MNYKVKLISDIHSLTLLTVHYELRSSQCLPIEYIKSIRYLYELEKLRTKEETWEVPEIGEK